MRWLLINADYPAFLDWLYASQPGLESMDYSSQMRARNATLFGTADFYSSHLRRLGHEASDVHFNNAPLQAAWAAEHGVAVPAGGSTTSGGALRKAAALAPGSARRLVAPLIHRLRQRRTWFHDVLAAQIADYRPDIIFNHDPAIVSSRFLEEVRGRARLLVAQIASPPPPIDDLRRYDLVLSSIPHLVQRFRNGGAASDLLRLAFERRILDVLGPASPTVDVSFVGTLSAHHASRIAFLRRLREDVELSVWAPHAPPKTAGPLLRASYMGPAWGTNMFNVLRSSRVTINHHIDVAGNDANNMRLFEATGVGTLLLTDRKSNLADLFESPREVVTYRDAEDCAETIGYFLSHEADRAAVADAGQRRTLSDHSYDQRMPELVSLIEARL